MNKKITLTIAFDMKVNMRDDQDPEEIVRAYKYLIGLGENWRIIHRKED